MKSVNLVLKVYKIIYKHKLKIIGTLIGPVFKMQSLLCSRFVIGGDIFSSIWH